MFYLYYNNKIKDILLGTISYDKVEIVLNYLETHDFDLTLFKIIPICDYPLYFSKITPFEEIFNKIDSFEIEATIME